MPVWSCGADSPDVVAELNDFGELIISGNGRMKDYDNDLNKAPWLNSHREYIIIVVVKECVTYIGAWAFAGCNYMTSAIISESVTSIGDWAFSNCTNLMSVTDLSWIANGLGKNVFWGCTRLERVPIPYQ